LEGKSSTNPSFFIVSNISLGHHSLRRRWRVLSVFHAVTEEREREILDATLKAIRGRGAETGALLVLRAAHPVSRMGGMAVRVMLGPLVPFLPGKVEDVIWTLEKEENIQWLIDELEKKEGANKEPLKAE